MSASGLISRHRPSERRYCQGLAAKSLVARAEQGMADTPALRPGEPFGAPRRGRRERRPALVIAGADHDAAGSHAGMEKQPKVERGLRRNARSGPVVRTATRLGRDDHRQSLVGAAQADPQRRLKTGTARSKKRLRRAIARRRGSPGTAKCDDAVARWLARARRLALARR